MSSKGEAVPASIDGSNIGDAAEVQPVIETKKSLCLTTILFRLRGSSLSSEGPPRAASSLSKKVEDSREKHNKKVTPSSKNWECLNRHEKSMFKNE
jgi:hypothetical protein